MLQLHPNLVEPFTGSPGRNSFLTNLLCAVGR